MANRGELTPPLRKFMEEFLGRKTSVRELRLIPYVAYVAVNEQKIEPARINQEERAILRLWKDAGHFEGGMTGVAITREFWDFMNGVQWLAYVAYREQEEAVTA
jgi:hypothetical protein